MTTTVKAVTARVPHLCEGCHFVPSLRGVATIQPGHRYLLHTAFPDGVDIQGDAPWAVNECVSCAVDRGEEHRTDACLTYCHGDVPCARPFRHDGDHSCGRCPTGPGPTTSRGARS